jgi:uncharacterized iron-regulated membrane protein
MIRAASGRAARPNRSDFKTHPLKSDPRSVSMSDTQTAGPSRGQKLYFTVWRWHFYAGIFVVPFLLMLACTGLVMLWFTAVAPEYGERITLPPVQNVQNAQTELPVSEQAAAALAQYPDGVIGQYIAPYTAENPAIFRVDLADGARMVAVNPHDGTVVQDRDKAGTWNEFATDIHGALLLGTFGDRVIEVAASLGVVLLASGLYLWWPRNGAGWREVLVLRLTATGRAFWKSLHQVLGFWLSLFLAFFLVSGLAWAGVWGGMYVQAWSSFPAEKFDNVPLSNIDHSTMNMGAEKAVPWALEQTPMPESGSEAGVTGLPEGVPVVLENVVALGRAIGFAGRFQVNAPADGEGVWTLSQDSMSYDSASPTADRTVHVDQYTGKILATILYADYSVGGKAMAVGVALHEGQLGLWNVVLNAVYCLGVILLAVSGVVMWWLRRPVRAARLAAPPRPADNPLWKGAALVGLVLSLAFPLAGAALLAVLVLDWLILSRVPALRRVLS